MFKTCYETFTRISYYWYTYKEKLNFEIQNKKFEYSLISTGNSL